MRWKDLERLPNSTERACLPALPSFTFHHSHRAQVVKPVLSCLPSEDLPRPLQHLFRLKPNREVHPTEEVHPRRPVEEAVALAYRPILGFLFPFK